MDPVETTDRRAAVALTDQQQRIVAHDRGPALVYAVAGAGKTTAMVRRVERLVRERIFAPQRILLSSFNKSAVDDLGRALSAWPHCRQVARHTLHALGYKIVRHAAERGRLPRLAHDALKVGGEERQLLWAARDQARQRGLVAPGELDGLDEQDLLDYIGACKGNLLYADLDAAGLPPAALEVARQAEPPPNLPWYLDLYRLHEEARRERGWLTFDDMLLLGWEALVRHPDVLAFWQRSYDAVIVDEFQDVNLAQAEILDQLAQPHSNFMAIGDDDQTIYGFRGASMSFFRGFGRRYSAAVYEMTDNFRCRPAQVVLANRVIQQNKERHPKALVATRGFGGATALRRSADTAAMARQLVDDIVAAQAAGFAGAEIAVLVRLTAQTPPVEQALITAGIPYRIAGEEPFFRRREIVDLLRYVELADADALLRAGGRLDGEAGERFAACWRSLYNRPKRYLNRQLLQETTHAVLRQRRPLSEVLAELAEKVAERTGDTLRDLAELLVWVAEERHRLPAEALLRELDWRLGYQDFLARSSGFAATGAGYAANVAAFLDYARGKGTLAELERHLAGLEAERKELDAGDPRAVDIRTIHRAKGLEWPVVLIPNCTAGIIPVGGAEDVEEERRLLYVAVTRAKERLFLYAPAGDGQLSPFLVGAGVDVTLARAEDARRILAADPLSWTAAEALNLATLPRHAGQERFFTHWWDAPPAGRRRIAGRIMAFIAAVTAHGGVGRLGLADADGALWAALEPANDPDLAAPFLGLEALCPPRPGAGGRAPAGPPSQPPFAVGEQVSHPQFGQGIVLAVDGSGTGRGFEWYLTIQFAQRGVVKLLGSIAPLRRLG
jgi:DNA helicase-2/ATP-dependent DNA helicase PcrA